ncbi:helix-turn-helix domain-containing protein [Hungatella effluvii]|uniref:helix-turn-helix domain-containing protein n=1 Tax=Hungatella effluvii TaxID=1096246 RepID=UPI0022E1A503|nr:helix-turn-helix transcriptional regulator [Hungatella effluvii]
MFDVLGRINELRNTRKWSVYRLAQLSGIPQSTIATWYQKNLYPPIDKLEMICNTFDITLSEFFSTDSNVAVNQKQMEIINKWELLSSKQKLAIQQIMEAFIDN